MAAEAFLVSYISKDRMLQVKNIAVAAHSPSFSHVTLGRTGEILHAWSKAGPPASYSSKADALQHK